jgi:flagellum-specific peptidoglycan hydrolase FlgJ
MRYLLLLFPLLLSNQSPYKAYFAHNLPAAQFVENHYGVPVSVQYAQAIIESGCGRSNIAKQAHNHFGIRCGDSYNGGRYYSKSGCWRDYDSIWEGYIDHGDFLCTYYPNAVFRPSEYWQHLEGYGERGYWRKVYAIILRYDLKKYDKK